MIRPAPIHTALCLALASAVAADAEAAKAPLSPAQLQEQATHVVSGRVLEVRSKVQTSTVEKAFGIHKDRVFTIKLKVKSVAKGEGIRADEEILIEAWQPATRIPPLPGLQGHRPVPSEGDSITLYAAGKSGAAFRPLLPNGIDIERPDAAARDEDGGMPRISDRVGRLFGGAAAAELIAARAGRADWQAYRIDPRGAGQGADEAKLLHGHPILSGPVKVAPETRRAIAGALLADDTYLWDVAKACEFMPGVAVRISDDTLRVDVLLCFSCDELKIYRDGERVGGEDFDPRRAVLLRAAKQLFPQDKAIQALKPSR